MHHTERNVGRDLAADERRCAVQVFLLTGNPWWYRGVLESLRQSFDIEQVVIPPQRISRSQLGVIARRLWIELRYTPEVTRLLFRRDQPTILLCSTNHFSALLAGKLGRYLGVRVRIYLFHFYLFGQAFDLHGLSERRVVKLVLRYLLSQDIGLFLTSPNEAAYYRQLSPGAQIEYYPYAADDVPSVPEDAISLGDFVFAGGYTNRDYDIVVEAARRFEGTQFVLACSAANRLPSRLPPNVQVRRDVDRVTFHTLMAGSRCVVVPLKANVGSSGQMVALAAKQLGKMTVYANYPPIAQYFTDGDDGLAYRPGDLDDLCAKLDYCLDDSAGVLSMGAKSRERYLRDFSAPSFYARIVDHFLAFAGVEH
jgi:glycosyltransferase involved in cell wall biosynthesis